MVDRKKSKADGSVARGERSKSSDWVRMAINVSTIVVSLVHLARDLV